MKQSGIDPTDYTKRADPDKFLKKLSFDERTQIFLKMQERLLVGEEKASD